MDHGDLRHQLAGLWVRSAEEETDGDLVFRPSDHDFPPARAPRPALRLKSDGTVVALAAGPADRPEPQPGGGHWSGRELSLRTPQLSGEFVLDLVEPDRLVVRPRSGSSRP